MARSVDSDGSASVGGKTLGRAITCHSSRSPSNRSFGLKFQWRLGSTPIHAFFAVTLPLLYPSIIGAALFAFAVSLDQFVISYFLATPGFTTLPVQIYSAIRKGFMPEINAISRVLLFASMAVIIIVARFAKPGAVRDKR